MNEFETSPESRAAHPVGTRRVQMGLLLVALHAVTASLYGAGDEYSLRGGDLQVTVSSKWAGCSSGGYYPIRILVQNRGADCTASFVFSSEHEGLAAVRRTLSVAQNATVRFSLPVPCVGDGTYGVLKVYRNGRLVEGLTHSVTVPEPHIGGTVRPSLLVISPTDVDFDQFEAAVVATLPEATSGGGGGYGVHGYYGIASENHERVEATLLPEEWIAYSGLDFVALPLPTLARMTLSERSALLKWVHTGGSLIVYEVGGDPAQSMQLNELLELQAHAAVSSEWQPAEVSRRTRIRVVELDTYGNILTPEEVAAETSTSGTDDFVWDGDVGTFAGRDLMLGHVYAFRENPFPGSPHDWNWFLTSVAPDARNWSLRHGISARYGSDEFLQFLIPSVRGVPVMAFLLLITLFTVVIGPLNYIFLWRRRRLYLLVLTIPLIALGTSLALFGYSAVAHGFATKSRARTLTYVDQTAKSAVTMGRIALYAGLAPSDGLQFSADTAVMPIWPEDHQFDSAMTDWTDQQNLRNGWLSSRTRTQFLTIGHRDERGRLDVAASGEGLTTTNGFAWGLQALLVCDQDGELYFGRDIPAGGSAELAPMTDQQRQEFGELLNQYPLAPPDLSGASGSWFDWNIGSFYGYEPSQDVAFSDGRLEQLMSQARNQRFAGATFPDSSYVAVLQENPGIELGVDRTRPQASLHVLMGRY